MQASTARRLTGEAISTLSTKQHRKSKSLRESATKQTFASVADWRSHFDSVCQPAPQIEIASPVRYETNPRLHSGLAKPFRPSLPSGTATRNRKSKSLRESATEQTLALVADWRSHFDPVYQPAPQLEIASRIRYGTNLRLRSGLAKPIRPSLPSGTATRNRFANPLRNKPSPP